MPSARRVRQDAEAAARRYAEYGKLVAAYNARIDKMNSGNQAAVDLYNQQVSEFNDFMDRVKAGQEYAVADIGFSNLYGGADPYADMKAEDMIVNGQIQKPLTPEEQKQELAYQHYVREQQNKLNMEYLQSGGLELSKAPQYLIPTEQETKTVGGITVPVGTPPPSGVVEGYLNSTNDPNLPSRPAPTYVAADSEEGKKLLADWKKPAGQFAMVTGKNNEAGDLKLVNVDKKTGLAKDAGFMLSGGLPDPLPNIGGFSRGTETYWLRNGDGTATRYERKGGGAWQAVSPPMRIAEWNQKAPEQQTDAGTAPEAPKDWNPSLRERRELTNPTLDAAGANKAAAMGSYGNIGLMNEASRNSALVDSAGQPLTSTDTGVLNRVMRGIL